MKDNIWVLEAGTLVPVFLLLKFYEEADEMKPWHLAC